MSRCILGFRFTNKGFAVAVLTGKQSAPTLKFSQLITAPAAFKFCEIAKWTKHELQTLLTTHSPTFIAMKAFEGMKKDKSYEERLRLEGVLHVCAGEANFKDIARKRKSTIAKDFGLKGKGSYVDKIDTAVIPDFKRLDKYIQEAALVAWSELK